MRNVGQRINNVFEFYRLLSDKIKNDIRVSMPGIIQSFNPDEQTVTVQLSLRERIRDKDGNMSHVALPILPDVPIIFPRAGGFSITFPVQKGDECLVIFGDMCIDSWWASGGIQNQIEKRRHDLSDGFAILGVGSQANVVSNYNVSSMELRSDNGNVIIELSQSSVKVKGSGVNFATPGEGALFTSPDGEVTKKLTINNDGDPVWS